jgi:hypothetical protein
MNIFLFDILTYLNIHPNKHIYVLNEIKRYLLDLHLKLQILQHHLMNILMKQ